METGRYDPSLTLAFRIARLFGQPIPGIFHPDNQPNIAAGSHPNAAAR